MTAAMVSVSLRPKDAARLRRGRRLRCRDCRRAGLRLVAPGMPPNTYMASLVKGTELSPGAGWQALLPCGLDGAAAVLTWFAAGFAAGGCAKHVSWVAGITTRRLGGAQETDWYPPAGRINAGSSGSDPCLS